MRLYGFWRSSATYRVRIALAFKGLPFEQVSTDLRRGEHRTLTFLERNPQGLVPVLEDGDLLLTQSMAILEYLEERYPDPPLLPRHPVERARVRALAQFIACEIHPLNNLRVLNHVRRTYGLDSSQVRAWYRHWIEQGFAPLETELARTAGRYAYGEKVSMADVLLVPQVLNARRYDCELDAFPILRDVERNCLELPAFDRPPPEPDADAS